MLEILTVCTGNICRSPLAAQLLQARLAPLEAHVHSAGTHGLDSAPMTPEAVRIATGLGVTAEVSASHRSRYLTERMLAAPDLILAMTRDHRRLVAELAPSRLRSTFTVREFARLSESVPDDELLAAAESAGTDASARIRAATAVVAARRGLQRPRGDGSEDDVIDPYRRSWQTYQLSAEQLLPAVDEVARVVRLTVAAG